jgi:transposase
MAYIQGESRNQLTLTPLCLDDYVDENNICRVIDAYVRSLDLTRFGFKYADTKSSGRPPYDPAQMLMLYIYGYLNHVRSSRRLEAEATRNLEVMWLLGKLVPDDRTICNFRKDNAKVLKNAFREFSLWCNRAGLYGGGLVGVDGIKNRANNNRKHIHTKKGAETKLAEVEKKITGYMKALEENDDSEQSTDKPSPEVIGEILKHLNEKKDTLSGWLKEITENGGNEISEYDPDSRLMHTNG